MTSSTITGVHAWEALDSRGTPTVACRVEVADGSSASVRVPSGASTGRYEALELRDGGSRYKGRGVSTAVGSVRDELSAAVIGIDAADTRSVDEALAGADGSPGFARVGSNAVLAVSLAALRAAARARRTSVYRLLDKSGQPPLMPMPMVNVISGGMHAGGMVGIQDVLAIPRGASTFAEAIEWIERVRRGSAETLDARGHNTALVADEGGLAARLSSDREALGVVVEGIGRAGLEPGSDVVLAVDVAANQLRTAAGYRLDGREFSVDQYLDEIAAWTRDFPLVSVEDPLADNDDVGWARLRSATAGRVQLVADDYAATNVDRVRSIVAARSANALLVKPNQVGTVSRAADALELARDAGFNIVVSARSGDTEDSWLADLAVGWRAGQIKVGSTMRSERTSKWNRLLEIESREATTLARFDIPG